MSTERRLRAVDLFCGCGGISAGLRMAGFDVIAGADSEPKYMATFAHNFEDKRSYQIDLSSKSSDELMKKLSITEGSLDLLVGGPPCQGFSKNVPRKYRYLTDENNLLTKAFLNYCESIRPRMVLMENVAEMESGFERAYSDEIINRLNGLGYTVTEAALNAADYGVPQRRRRAFFLANRDGLRFEIPKPTHRPPSDQFDLLRATHVSVWEAIGDLPSLDHGEMPERSEYACEPHSDYQRLMRNGSKAVANHVARRLRPTQYARLAALGPGQGLKDLPPELRVKSGYSGAYGRLTKDMVAPTITRWVFHPGSGRWGHPVDIRTLSIREIARIQGFPDSFEFVGTFTDQAGQLGNAAPPLLIECIAESMVAQLVTRRSHTWEAITGLRRKPQSSPGLMSRWLAIARRAAEAQAPCQCGRGGGMTKRQRECLDFILLFWERHRYGPSYQEIADALGMSQRSTAYRMVKLLCERGFLVKSPGHARSIRCGSPICTCPGELLEASGRWPEEETAL
jgi:DNA (cytosine-5)-methyltransferase 1|tara:strand:- start:890 stop:2422 length:1533 start_codon:yes stop_codon:yes gene_type:complete